MALFSFEQLSFAYPQGPELLQDTSFSFQASEKIGFHGPNGCGKSSFFLLVTGLLKPKSGHIRFHDRIISKEKEFRALRREVGLVLQNADDQLFHATVLEDLAFGPLNLGLSPAEAKKRAEATLEQLGLSNLRDRLTHQLSGGEKRLIALASILAMQPRVLLLDEPTNDLDPVHKKKLMQILHELQAGWIIISHDFDFLRDTCTGFMSIEGQQVRRSESLHVHQHVHAHPLGDMPHAHE